MERNSPKTNRQLAFPCLTRRKSKASISTKDTYTLPPELVEDILKRITDHNTLLRCRLVCFQWQQIAEDLLEKAHISKLTSWDPQLDLRFSKFITSLPSIRCRDTDNSDFYANSRVLSSILKNQISGRNPFPYNSITIFRFRESTYLRNRWRQRLQYKNTKKLVNFFQQTGQFLTSIIFYAVRFRGKDLTLILGFLASLKVLSFSSVVVYTKPENLKIFHNSLTHLQIINCESDMFVNFFKFLNLPQLLNLKLVNYWDYYNLELAKFTNLRQLSITNGKLLRIKKCQNFPLLEYLSFTDCYNLYQHNDDDEEEVLMDLMEKISSSLVHLRLNVNEKTLLENLKVCGATFPNIRVFETGNILNSDLETTCLKEMLLPWFPNLGTVKLLQKLYRDDGNTDYFHFKEQEYKMTFCGEVYMALINVNPSIKTTSCKHSFSRAIKAIDSVIR